MGVIGRNETSPFVDVECLKAMSAAIPCKIRREQLTRVPGSISQVIRSWSSSSVVRRKVAVRLSAASMAVSVRGQSRTC